jgi:hypothetical protein
MRLAWMHADCLHAGWLPPDAEAIYIFDDAQLASADWGLKRIMFVYETLLELPVEIRRGPLVETLLVLEPELIITVDTPDPWLRHSVDQLRRSTHVDVLPAPVFVELDGRVDLKRFSRYWSKAERKLLK